MILAFELTMPSPPSWNGKWSGEDRRWIVFRTFATDGAAARVAAYGRVHCYRWSDGWQANISVWPVSHEEMNRLLKLSAGFNGYDWMVNSIIDHGKIYADHEKPKAAAIPVTG